MSGGNARIFTRLTAVRMITAQLTAVSALTETARWGPAAALRVLLIRHAVMTETFARLITAAEPTTPANIRPNVKVP